MLIKILLEKPVKKTIMFATAEKFYSCQKTVKMIDNWLIETFPRKVSLSYTWSFVTEK